MEPFVIFLLYIWYSVINFAICNGFQHSNELTSCSVTGEKGVGDSDAVICLIASVLTNRMTLFIDSRIFYFEFKSQNKVRYQMKVEEKRGKPVSL